MDSTNDTATSRIEKLEATLATVLERNRKVEIEKSWETSNTRKITIVILTYALMCLIFWWLGVENLFRNAIIPTLGYYLSTQSLPMVKKWWLRRQDRH